MIDLDFVEIGTSDFRTLIQDANDNTKGISIEPIKEYLDRLPNKQNVKKIHCAISLDEQEGKSIMYYIPPETINKHKLPKWIKGCNSLGQYHKKHIEKNLQEIVSTCEVDIIPLGKILLDNNIKGINFLKIDTEGCDCYILKTFINYLKSKNKEYYPKKIQFESNRLTSKSLINETIKEYNMLGYSAKQGKEDTILTLN